VENQQDLLIPNKTNIKEEVGLDGYHRNDQMFAHDLAPARELESAYAPPLDESFRKLAAIMDEIDPPPLGQGEPVPVHPMMNVDYDHDALLLLKYVEPWLVKANDPNQENWANIKGLTDYDSVEGFWSSRWRREENVHAASRWHVGTAHIQFYKDWVHITMHDDTSRYVIRCKVVENNKLVGRYLNCEFSEDNSPWVGIIVNNHRIDGFWQTRFRWDFRR
jgi:hypothetical protein